MPLALPATPRAPETFPALADHLRNPPLISPS